MAQLTNRRPLFTGPGNNTVFGDSDQWGVLNLSRIYTQAGNDVVEGIGGSQDGIFNLAIINTGSGDDKIKGVGVIGIASYGVIVAWTGNDFVEATGAIYGLFNTDRILLGAGNDTLESEGDQKGIYNLYRIETGSGNDLIRAVSDPVTGVAIDNGGLISTARGNDTIDALTGGFAGNGLVSLGRGDDVLKGFGTGYFTGGSGQDQVLFGEGTYEIQQIDPSAFAPRIEGLKLRKYIGKLDQGDVFRVSSAGTEMTIALFESVGGANGGLFSLASGTLVVDSAGVATFS